MKRSGFEPWPGSLCCVLRQETLFSQCLSAPRSITGYQQIYWGYPRFTSIPYSYTASVCMLRKLRYAQLGMAGYYRFRRVKRNPHHWKRRGTGGRKGGGHYWDVSIWTISVKGNFFMMAVFLHHHNEQSMERKRSKWGIRKVVTVMLIKLQLKAFCSRVDKFLM